MKNIITTAMLSALFFSAGAQNKVIVKGKFDSPETVKMVYLNHLSPEGFRMDSAEFKEGSFTFRKEIEEPSLAILIVRFKPVEGQARPRTDRMDLFLEKGTLEIKAKDSLKFATVKGSKAHNEFTKLNSMQNAFDRDIFRLRSEYKSLSEKNNTDPRLSEIGAKMRKVSKSKHENLYDYIIENPNSPIALFVLDRYAGPDIDVAAIEPIFKSLPVSLKTSPSGLAYEAKLEAARRTSVGAMAMNFTQNDTLGKPVSLSSFQGKYLLIDFWASWCGPCRAENPNLVKEFHNYKDKGFTVLGVSLDQPGKHEAWMEAIRKDKLEWTQVSDLRGWNNEVAKMYNIQAVPQNFLLDPTGKIIGKNIRGEELGKTLAELFK